MQNLPPQIIKTPEVQVSQPFDLSVNTAAKFVPKINQNGESGESNQLAQQFETINVVNLGQMIEPRGQYYGNDRVIYKDVRYCNNNAFIQTVNRRIQLDGGCGMIDDIGGMGIARNININGQNLDMVIIARDGQDVMAFRVDYFNSIYNTDIRAILNNRTRENAEKIRNILLGRNNRHRSEIKTLDQYVAMTVAEESISTKIPNSVIPNSSIISKNKQIKN